MLAELTSEHQLSQKQNHLVELYVTIRGTCTQLYPAASESLTWRDICRSGTTETLNNQSESKTSVVGVSVTLERTLRARCRVFWSRSHWPGSRERSRTRISLWTRPPRPARLLPPLLWGYLAETRRVDTYGIKVTWHWIHLLRSNVLCGGSEQQKRL